MAAPLNPYRIQDDEVVIDVPVIIRSYDDTVDSEFITEKLTIDFLKRTLGDHIAVVRLTRSMVLLVIVDGKSKGLPVNKAATYLVGDVVYGEVILCRDTDLND